MAERFCDVRFTPESGHRLRRLECPLCAKSRHGGLPQSHHEIAIAGFPPQCVRQRYSRLGAEAYQVLVRSRGENKRKRSARREQPPD